MKSTLLCTFSNVKNYNEDIDGILDHYTINFNKIYILQNNNNQFELFLTYNVSDDDINNRYSNTISIHRKKQTNTLYTINSLNEVIKLENNNVLDNSYQINWNLYSNTLLVIREDGLKKFPTKIFKIVDI